MGRVLTVDRRLQILKLLEEKDQVHVFDLSRMFNVSEVTIRNDLDQLEKKNLLIRARGGAIKANKLVSIDRKLDEKSRLNEEQKKRIGKRAASLINENDTIILDSGTTTAEVAKCLEGFENLTVITNALNIINTLTRYPKINVVVPGGNLRVNSMSLVGPMAERNLKNLNVDKVFLGVDGFDSSIGAFTPNIEEAHLNEIMIEIAMEVILVMDSTKFSRHSLARFCDLSKIDIIVSDTDVSANEIASLRDTGIKLIMA